MTGARNRAAGHPPSRRGPSPCPQPGPGSRPPAAAGAHQSNRGKNPRPGHQPQQRQKTSQSRLTNSSYAGCHLDCHFASRVTDPSRWWRGRSLRPQRSRPRRSPATRPSTTQSGYGRTSTGAQIPSCYSCRTLAPGSGAAANTALDAPVGEQRNVAPRAWLRSRCQTPGNSSSRTGSGRVAPHARLRDVVGGTGH